MRALIVVDMLNDFVLDGAPLHVPNAMSIVPHIRREIDRAHAEGYPVVYVCDAHSADDSEFAIWPVHCVEGSHGADVVQELAPAASDIVLQKTRYSGFYNTRLEEILRANGVDTVIVTGVVTNICVLYTVSDAAARGFKTIVPADCIMGLDAESHQFAIQQMKNVHYTEFV